jgi:hypothetical protein
MKEHLNELATVIAVSILADGEFDEKENLQLLSDLESDTELPGLAASVKQVVSMAHLFTDEQLTDLLYKSAEKFGAEDKPKVFEAAITTILADGVVTEDEIANILTLAEALDIPTEKAVARLLYQVQELEGDLVVDVEDELQDFIIVGGKTRYTGWNAFEKMLSEKAYPAHLIDILRAVNDWAAARFGSKAEVNYTPNFLTLACTNPASRSKTFCFVRMRKADIRFEYTGNVADLTSADQFGDALQKGIEQYFGQLSADKL